MSQGEYPKPEQRSSSGGAMIYYDYANEILPFGKFIMTGDDPPRLMQGFTERYIDADGPFGDIMDTLDFNQEERALVSKIDNIVKELNQLLANKPINKKLCLEYIISLCKLCHCQRDADFFEAELKK